MADGASPATPPLDVEVRARILAAPELILEDPDVMRALVAARERSLGDNIVDLRGMAMERLETRLERLEDTHRFVLAAAYDNVSGTQLIQRAVLALLEPADFAEFLLTLGSDVPEILRVDRVHLVLESAQAGEEPGLGALGRVLSMVPPGFIEDYAVGARNAPMRPVTLRPVPEGGEGGETLYGADTMGSEALMKLDIGRGRLPGLLVLASREAQHFRPSHGTDLLTFFAEAFERLLRRWLT